MKNLVILSRKSGFSALIACLLFLGLVFTTTHTRALENPAITVTPGVINVELTELGQTVDSEIEISSNYAQATTLDAALSGVDDSTGVLVANGPLNENLKQSMSLSSSQVVIPANGKATISLKVFNSDLLSPGGHYAAVTLSQASGEQAQVNLQSTISISVFIVKRGGEKVELSIKDQILKLSPFRLPSESTLTYENTGNVVVTPRASVTVRSMDGNSVYAKGISNEGSLSILPGKTLEDTFPISKIVKLPFIPTKLKYITEYRADGISNAQYTERQAWYIPPIFIIFVMALLVLIAILLSKWIKKWRIRTQKRKKKPTPKKKASGGLISDITPAPKQSKPGSEKTD